MSFSEDDSLEGSRRPRRSTASKLFYKKKVWIGEGLIRKMVVHGDEVIRWKADLDKEFPDGAHKSDGLNVGVCYALKKKNRHLFPESVESGQFNLEAAKYPSSLETVAVNRVLSNYRGKTNRYFFEGICNRGVFSKVTIINREGEMTSLKGIVMAPDRTPGLNLAKTGKEESLHYLYNFNEYEYIPKVHRPSYKCGCWSCTHPRSEELKEEFILGKNVPRTGHLTAEDDWLGSNLDEGEGDEKEECSTGGCPSATFNLGDIPLQKSKRRAKKRVDDGWVLV